MPVEQLESAEHDRLISRFLEVPCLPDLSHARNALVGSRTCRHYGDYGGLAHSLAETCP